jgi:hypothetical protein
MQSKDTIDFRKDVMYHYEQMMPALYIRYRQYTPIAIKLELLSILSAHILSAAKENVRKGAHRKLKFAQLKRKVSQYESEIGKVDELKAVERSF